MKFEFELYRSEEKEHQVAGLKCSSFEVRGQNESTSIYRVKEFAIRLMAIPGVYFLQIRNAAENGEWRDFGPIDTRNPEQAASPKTSNRKPKTEAKQL
jgi:hypothetical protein